MYKTLFLALALGTTNVALACGGKACAHCDAPATTAQDDVSQAAGTKLALKVDGMNCGKCSARITAALKAIDGVNAVRVSHETGRAELAFDEAKTTADALIAAIVQLEFKAERVEEPAKEG